MFSHRLHGLLLPCSSGFLCGTRTRCSRAFLCSTACLTRKCFFRGGAVSLASVLLTDASRSSLCCGRALPVLLSPLKNPVMLVNQHPLAVLSRVRLQSPAWLNERRASLHERARSLL